MRTNESRSFPSRMHNKLRRQDLSRLLTIAQFEKTPEGRCSEFVPVAGVTSQLHQFDRGSMSEIACFQQPLNARAA
jgi:hypothetical protein